MMLSIDGPQLWYPCLPILYRVGNEIVREEHGAIGYIGTLAV
jgi:hypothetical protein